MKNQARRLIGLTGGIATGKTTVSNYLAQQYNLPVLDADLYAREAVDKGSKILKTILQRYGTRLQLPDGNLNRAALGDIVFNNSAEKQWLEMQIHPVVRDRFTRELSQIDTRTVVLSIPLLFEANLTSLVTETWVVSCDRALQIERLQQRNNLTVTQAKARIDSQMPLQQKIALADLVLVNDGSLSQLYTQIDRVMTAVT